MNREIKILLPLAKRSIFYLQLFHHILFWSSWMEFLLSSKYVSFCAIKYFDYYICSGLYVQHFLHYLMLINPTNLYLVVGFLTHSRWQDCIQTYNFWIQNLKQVFY